MRKNKNEPVGLAIIKCPDGEIVKSLYKKIEWGFSTVTIWLVDDTIQTTGVNNVLTIVEKVE